MIKKILWTTDGSEDSFAALEYAELLANKCNADICGLAVLSEDYGFLDGLPPDESSVIRNRIQQDLDLIARKRFEKVSKEIKERGLNFSYEVVEGIVEQEIIKAAENENSDIIAMGKGRASNKFVLGETALKVVRNCTIPILTARHNGIKTDIKRILVPIALSHGITANFDYALKLSRIFNSKLYLTNIVETSDHKFQPELLEKIKSHTKRDLGYVLGKSNVEDNIEIQVGAAKNAWIGITKFARENDIDLIVMMTYGGIVLKKEFMGSVTWRVIQETSIPVITLSPSKIIMKMTGDAK